MLAAVVVLVFGLNFTVAAEEGVTDTEIHIGQWGPQTGPAAPWGSVARGSDAYFKMINDAGGIHGRKIVYHMFDDGYNPAKTMAGVKELQEGVGIFAWASGVGTAPGMAVREYLMERKVPWVGAASGSHHWITPPEKYQFATYPLYYNEAMALCRYAVKTLGSKKIAMAYQNDGYGKNGVEGAENELKRHGLDLVAKVPVEAKRHGHEVPCNENEKSRGGHGAFVGKPDPRDYHHGNSQGHEIRAPVDERQHSVRLSTDVQNQQRIVGGCHHGIICRASRFRQPADEKV